MIESEIKNVYIFPDDHRVGVSKDGDFYNLKTKKKLKKNIGKAGYYNITISSPGKKLKTYRCHRILAITFKPIPEQFKDVKVVDLLVNHLNGIKLDISLDNLEWTDDYGNVVHAYKNDLHTVNKPVQIKNLITGEISVCYSGGEVVRTYGIKHPTLFKHLHSQMAGQTDYSNHAFRFKSDEPWPEIKKKGNLFVKVLFLDENGKGTFYTNLKAFCNSTNLSYRTVYGYVIKATGSIKINNGVLKVIGD